MKSTPPLCCTREAYALLARQMPVINSPDALLNGAIAISMHQNDGVKVAAVDAQIQGYVDKVRSRVRGSQPQAILAHLHDVLFDEEGFTGNLQDYYSPLNSYVPAVLRTKKGLPITLSLIYKTIAERLGLRAWGVGLPGHFLAAVQIDDTPMLIDAFAGGQMLTNDEAHERMIDRLGPETEWSDELLRPVSNRHWLTRILQNLLNVFGSQNHFADVAAVLEMEMLLWPEQHHLQRDLALVLARCGLAQPAVIWLDRYITENPDDPQYLELKQLLQVLK